MIDLLDGRGGGDRRAAGSAQLSLCENWKSSENIKNPIKILTFSGYAFAAAAATGHTVVQTGKSFSEKKLEIAVGDSITFKNDDEVKHNILIKDIDFNSGVLAPGSESTATFATAGRYKLRCGIHPKMKVVVQ